MNRFTGKVALVTGASSGLGRATAVRLASEGAAVGLLGRRLDALNETREQIRRGGGSAVPIVADVTIASEVKRATHELADRYGGIDLLAHAAGVFRSGEVTTQTEEEWDLLFDTNVKSCFLLGRYVIPWMRLRSRGAIVNISSIFAFAADPGSAGYSATKAAVVGLTRIMALDHIGEGIRINSVAPATMRTAMVESVVRDQSSDTDEAFSRIGDLNPTGQLVAPTEVASIVAYLLSDEAASVVGACYPVDGGRMARLGSARQHGNV